MSRVEQVLDLARALAHLEARLTEKKRQLAACLRQDPPADTVQPTARERPARSKTTANYRKRNASPGLPPREGSVNAQIVALLDANVGRALTRREIAMRLGRLDKLNAVTAALSALNARGLIVRADAGAYHSPQEPMDSGAPPPSEPEEPTFLDGVIDDPARLLKHVDALVARSSAKSVEQVMETRAPRLLDTGVRRIATASLRENEATVTTPGGGFVIRRKREMSTAVACRVSAKLEGLVSKLS